MREPLAKRISDADAVNFAAPLFGAETLTKDPDFTAKVFAGEATRLAYMTDEAREGRDSFLERRAPDWSAFPYYA